MSKRLFSSFVSLLAMCFPIASFAQDSRSLLGTEFWVTFMENNFTPPSGEVYLMVAPLTKDTIRVYNPALNLNLGPFTVTPGVHNIIPIKLVQGYAIADVVAQPRGLKVTSKRKIGLYAYNNVTNSIAGTAVLPAETLTGKGKYVLNTSAGLATLPSQAAILALDDNTQVEVISRTPLYTGQAPGVPLKFTLKKGEVFVIQALDTGSLAGTTIQTVNSCKRLAVFMGSKCTRMTNTTGCNSCDILFEQAWPTHTFGKTFFIPAPPSYTLGYTVQVTALLDNTVVSVNGVPKTTLNKNQTYITNEISALDLCITTSKPASVAQITKSASCGGIGNNQGDPGLVNISALENGALEGCYITNRTGKLTDHYILIYARSPLKPKVFSNGTLLDTNQFALTTSCNGSLWKGTFKILENNTYYLQSGQEFFALGYGFSAEEGYALQAVSGAKNQNFDFSIQPKAICDTLTAVRFEAFGDSANGVRWLYGDGNNGTGNPSFHTYGKAGNFKATLLVNKNGDPGCPTDTLHKWVKVSAGPKVQLGPDTTLCEGKSFRIKVNFLPNLSYYWENGSQQDIQNVFQNRDMVLTVSDTLGCSNADTLKVKFVSCNNYNIKFGNSFSPNDDGTNDVFEIEFEGYTEVSAVIFNRWGQIVYEWNLPNGSPWNGKWKNTGKPLPDGTYYYQIIARNPEVNNVREISGAIFLFR